MEEKVFVFKVCVQKNSIYRTMELKGTTSLYQFAEVILRSFNFYFDHPFGFHDNINNMYDSEEVYTLFYDIGSPIDPKEKSVKQTPVCNVFQPNKKMLFHFDYGDDWMFLVECLGVADPEAGKTYPVITKRKGKAPLQYPPCD